MMGFVPYQMFVEIVLDAFGGQLPLLIADGRMHYEPIEDEL